MLELNHFLAVRLELKLMRFEVLKKETSWKSRPKGVFSSACTFQKKGSPCDAKRRTLCNLSCVFSEWLSVYILTHWCLLSVYLQHVTQYGYFIGMDMLYVLPSRILRDNYSRWIHIKALSVSFLYCHPYSKYSSCQYEAFQIESNIIEILIHRAKVLLLQ